MTELPQALAASTVQPRRWPSGGKRRSKGSSDYNGKQLIPAENAIWVIGGNKPGVMTKQAKWAFAEKVDAEKFIEEHGGRFSSLLGAMKAAFEDMYEILR